MVFEIGNILLTNSYSMNLANMMFQKNHNQVSWGPTVVFFITYVVFEYQQPINLQISIHNELIKIIPI